MAQNYNTQYDPRNFGTLLQETGANLLEIGGGNANDMHIINWEPEQYKELVHLIIGSYLLEKNIPPEGFMQNLVHPSLITWKPDRQAHAQQLEMLLIGIVSSRSLLCFV